MAVLLQVVAMHVWSLNESLLYSNSFKTAQSPRQVNVFQEFYSSSALIVPQTARLMATYMVGCHSSTMTWHRCRVLLARFLTSFTMFIDVQWMINLPQRIYNCLSSSSDVCLASPFRMLTVADHVYCILCRFFLWLDAMCNGLRGKTTTVKFHAAHAVICLLLVLTTVVCSLPSPLSLLLSAGNCR